MGGGHLGDAPGGSAGAPRGALPVDPGLVLHEARELAAVEDRHAKLGDPAGTREV